MDSFDYKFYYNLYPDLRDNNINTLNKLLLHYKINGRKENRYKNKYELLKANNFNPDIYRYNYEDLHKMSVPQLENHFISHGFKEKRNCSSFKIKQIGENEFDINVYKNYYLDLQNLNSLQLWNHYHKFGKNENRIINQDMLNGISNNLHYYIINLKSDTEKKNNMIEMFQKFNIKNYDFFEAFDGNNKFIQDKYNQYLTNYNNNVIKTTTYWKDKRKLISNIGCVGLLHSTVELFKKIQDKDYVCICEDDIYLHHNFNKLIKLINYKKGDLIYLGYNNHDKKVNYFLNNYIDNKLYNLPKNDSLNFFYGTYGYICNRKFRQKIIDLGIDWFLNNNSPIDCGYNIINFNSKLKYYAVTGEQLIIPEICNPNSINDRNNKEDFYKNRNIHKDKYINKQFISQTLMGGLGNQLFMVFNLISLAKDYETKYYIDTNFYDKKRQNPDYWSFFKNISKLDLSKLEDLKIYKEPEYIYNKIELDISKKNKLEGYYQSYKYFWHNRDEIKKHIFIDIDKINIIRNKFQEFGKPILSIHLRLTDYLKYKNYHPVSSIEYYKKAVSFYNLDLYQILLFSDDIENAEYKIKDLNLNYINANNIFKTDEEQFLMLCLSDIKICANSTFSLMSCYFTEIYKFVENPEYIFPNIFFGNEGPKYNLDDLMINYKFFVIDINNITYNKKYDVVSTIHSKDIKKYKKYIKYNKKYLVDSGNYYYISQENYNINDISYHISEDKFEFSKYKVREYLKGYIPDDRVGWYYQQLLKLYVFKVHNFNTDYILILDSDILLIKYLNFFKENIPILYKRLTGTRKIHKPYYYSIKYIIDLDINEEDSGICHMMFFNKNIINNMFIDIEKKHKKKLWVVILDCVIFYVKNYGYNNSIFSEYELYYNYSKNNTNYNYQTNLNYLDIAYDDFNFDSNDKIIYIADHNYLTTIDNNSILRNFLNKISKYKNNIPKNKQNFDIEDNYLDLLYSKFCNNRDEKISDKLCILNNEGFSRNDIVNIIKYENYQLLINIRKDIDNILKIFLDTHDLISNNYIKKISINNLNTNNNYFGIVIPIYNRYYITKIFLECLKKNINFESIVFCFVDDGSDEYILRELENINDIKHIIVYCQRGNNIYSSPNTVIPGSLYPMTLYIGHEILKNKCKILGVLDSDSFITPDYFNVCKEFTDTFDMDNTIFSGFNSYSSAHNICGNININRKSVLLKNMVGGI